MEIEVTREPGGAAFSAVQQGLDAFNASVAPDATATPLNVYLREDGALLGGLCAHTFWDWLSVGQVWVEESRRRQGVGRRLMAAAEAEAIERGCRHVYLDTVDVQAPGFYEKLGYRVVGTLEDFPPGGRKFFLTKDLG
ncbi:MAG: GNAT family N-acetyltransferase [Planctomycetota bacterium]